MRDTTRNAGMIFLVVVAATIFGNFISITGLPKSAVMFCNTLNNPILVMMLLMILQLILGCLMDGIVVLVLTLPIVYPVAMALGYDPIWLGVLMVLLSGIGMITPPVGLNAYVVQSIDPLRPKTSLSVIFKGITPYLLTSVACCIILILFPGLVTFIL